MIKILALTPGGLEKISVDEIRKIIGKSVNVERGQVSFYGDYVDAIKLNILCRTITRVLICIDEGSFKDLNDLARKISRLDFKIYFKDGYSFAVRCSRTGTHDFTSIDAARVVGGVIHNSLLSQNMKIRVDLNEPDIEFHLRIRDDRYQLCIDTSGEGLNRRGYRVYSHPAALNPVIAAAMIQILNWNGSKILVDPMCGGGTIPIEACMIVRKIPPGVFRGAHPIIKLPVISEDEYWRIREDAIRKKLDINDILCFGIDAGKKYIDGSILNASSAGVKENIKFICGDSRRLEKLIPDDQYFFAFNPPYGIRLTRIKAIPELYNSILKSLKNIGGFEGIIITAAESAMRKAIKNANYNILRIYKVMHGNLETTIFHIQR